MLQVVLDANTVGIRAPMAGNPHRLLLAAHDKGQLRLVMPEVVIREVANKWREKTEEQLAKFAAPARELAKYGVKVERPTGADLVEQAAQVERGLRDRLRQAGVATPGYPDVGHEPFVERALGRRKPFDAKGKNGYRDAVLWEAVIELAREDEVVLVSNDVRAFVDDDGESLDRTLRDEVEERVGHRGRIRLARDIHTVTDEVSEQDRETAEAIRRLVHERSFRVLLDEGLEDALIFFELDQMARSRLDLGIPVDYASISSPEELGQVDVVRAYRVGDEALAELAIDLSVTIALYASGVDALRLREREDVWLAGREWDELRARDENVELVTARYVRLSADIAIRMPEGAITRLAPRDLTVTSEEEHREAAHVVDDAR